MHSQSSSNYYLFQLFFVNLWNRYFYDCQKIVLLFFELFLNFLDLSFISIYFFFHAFLDDNQEKLLVTFSYLLLLLFQLINICFIVITLLHSLYLYIVLMLLCIYVKNSYKIMEMYLGMVSYRQSNQCASNRINIQFLVKVYCGVGY